MKAFRNNRIALIFLFALFFNLVKAHPVHVSLLNIEISKNRKITFVVKLFTDDFQDIINQKYHCNINIHRDTPLDSLQIFAAKYVQENLLLYSGNKVINNRYLLKKSETNHEAIWLYFEIENYLLVDKTISINNTFLCDKFEDQTNLLIMNYKGNKELAYKFDCKDNQKCFNFK